LSAIDVNAHRERLSELERDLMEIDTLWFAGEFGERTSELARTRKNNLAEPLIVERARLNRELEQVAEAMLRDRTRRHLSSAEFGNIQEAMRRAGNDPRFTNDMKRQFLERFVTEVRVDITRGTWELDIAFGYPQLSRLCGQLGVGDACYPIAT
jgi:hypothetical protein